MNIIIKYLILFSISTFFVFPSTIDEEYAYSIANKLYKKNIQNHNFMRVKNITYISHESTNLFYIFNIDPVGFIIISADNRAVPVLGYSFDNNFKYNNI